MGAAVGQYEKDPKRGAKELKKILTVRERQVFARIANGMQSKLIAHDLGISTRTVEIHRANIMTKLGASNVIDLVKTAMAD